MITKLVKVLCLLLVFFVCSNALLAQDNAGIALISQAKEDKILLRWAPKDFLTWNLSNKYGYTLERFTVLRDSMIVSPPEKVILGNLAPAPLQDWETKVDEDDYVAVAAQAIYGETFELTENYTSDIIQIVNKTREEAQRFSFALFAADQSFEAAQLSGLAFIDNKVKKNEKYLYKVYANIPDEIIKLDSGLTYLSIADYAPLTPVREVYLEISGQLASIKWNQAPYEKIYNSFMVERSADGGISYQSISELPILNSRITDQKQSKFALKTDSVSYGIEYSYRVKGITPFGEVSPPSKVVKGMSFEPLGIMMAFADVRIDGNNEVQLFWEFDSTMESVIEGFQVTSSNRADGYFTAVHDILLKPSERSFIHQPNQNTAYYKIEVHSANEVKSSFPYLVQLEDSIPPAVPVNILAKIDTLGVVTLKWDKNTERDFLGYRIYRANFKNSEFSELTVSPIEINQFKDSISLENLTSSVYYKVTTVDKRYNTSGFSKAIELNKPDIISPTPPVIYNFKINGDTVEIHWQPSSSLDVVAHQLYGRRDGEQQWLELTKAELSGTKFSYHLESEENYNIQIIAFDNSNNKSLPSNSIKIAAQRYVKTGVENLTYVLNKSEKKIFLSWKYTNPRTTGFIIYKKRGEAEFSFYATLDASSNLFIDKTFVENEKVSYAVIPKLSDNSLISMQIIQIKPLP